jgi:diaminopropionate ammonia-lyase
MLLKNLSAAFGEPLAHHDRALFTDEALAPVREYAAWRKGYEATRLIALDARAKAQGLGMIYVKDEATRLGMGSFKALGGAYAVACILRQRASEQLRRPLTFAECDRADVRAVASKLTFCCATDGNHGKSVAQGAKLFGARSVIYVHSGVSSARIQAIRDFGAEIVVAQGSYDYSVELAKQVCAERDWILVSDTSWDGYETTPALVMQGYTVLIAEAIEQIAAHPTHILIQAGVGGIAAAIAGYYAVRHPSSMPRIIVVEPDKAACLLASAKAGRPTKIPDEQSTVMSMLECFEPSLVAWRILERTATAFATVTDDMAKAAMKSLAEPLGADKPIVSGESGCVGLAALVQLTADRQFAEALELGNDARVLLINTEGATDPRCYLEIVGRRPTDVINAGRFPESALA